VFPAGDEPKGTGEPRPFSGIVLRADFIFAGPKKLQD
jgi:hypothetical protein